MSPPISDRDERLIDMRAQGFMSDTDLRRDSTAPRRPEATTSRARRKTGW